MARCETCDKDFETEEALAMHNSAKHHTNTSTNVVGKKSSKKWLSFIVLIILIAGVFAYFEFRPGANTTGNVVSDDIQKITLSFRGNYAPNTIEVKEGIPVEITLDSSVGGCYRSFAIPDLGVSKTSTSPSDKITFTPTKAGTFRFRCGMGMGTGTIIVN